MIGHLTGTLTRCSPDQVLLDVAGVGYELRIPLSTYYVLSEAAGGTVGLHVYTHVREDALQLFGFASTAERSAFEELIGISGVGPKVALALLSGIGAEELWQTVRRSDPARLQKIPGIGKKTAERVLLELRDRIDRRGGRRSTKAGPEPAVPSTGETEEDRARDDCVSALVNLGYTEDRAYKVVTRAMERLGPETGLEAILKAALGSLIE